MPAKHPNRVRLPEHGHLIAMIDVFTDPRFAGLHWSIPSNTPWEERDQAHLIAAHIALWRREHKEKVHYLHTHAGPVNRQTMTYLCCGQTVIDIHADKLRCKNGGVAQLGER